jgi:hypothetical protein
MADWPTRRIAIVGSRDFKQPHKVRQLLDSLPDETIVISGGARGVDSWAVERARERGLAVEVFEPDWKTWGRSAGYKRNVTIVSNADVIVAFWNGSRGTQHTVGLARKVRKPVVTYIEGTGVTPSWSHVKHAAWVRAQERV